MVELYWRTISGIGPHCAICGTEKRATYDPDMEYNYMDPAFRVSCECGSVDARFSQLGCDELQLVVRG